MNCHSGHLVDIEICGFAGGRENLPGIAVGRHLKGYRQSPHPRPRDQAFEAMSHRDTTVSSDVEELTQQAVAYPTTFWNAQ